ncbi:5,10-methylenetetrahydrofolate reductase/methionine synthase I (cobalamin-dependent) [Bacilli bacterium PM5-3]|nr:5,10-methylenetetrahydrofolate reductase/methionine synthase I (cobalamin-dependent) [Bacilli bacterium PM5-3]MDH6603193.1 5,10-methylenetetrahydrofolate reductase/methionine synthase I (cobalamin-dependent) [Bacilli bacterium PM5-9]
MNKYLDYIFDGSIGTYYAFKTKEEKACELFNISDAKTIIDIHKEYIDKGVNAIKTNSFRLNSNLLDDKEYRNLLIKKSVKNAREAVKDKGVAIFADIGPINITKENEDEYLEIVKVFESQRINHFIFETNIEYASLKKAVKYIKKYIKDSVVIVSFGFNQDGYTQLGYYYKNLCEEVSKDADYFGMNCICGPVHMYELASNLDTTKYNISIMPNAGYPSINHQPMFDHNADYFSDMLVKFASLDVKVLGGCCGSTPDHIGMAIEKINNTKIEYQTFKPQADKIINYKSNIKDILNSGCKLIAAEIEPPKTIDTSHLIESSYKLKKVGAHLLTLVDSPLGKTRADSLMIAAKIKNEVGINVLPHLTCRDKNQIAIKGGLIAANISGVNNVLALSGDAIAQIDREVNKGVFCFNSINLINYISELNKDIFFDNPFLIAGALNVNAVGFSNEIKRAKQKIEKNVDYFITQSIFSEEAIENLKLAYKELDVPIIVGLYPVASYKNALFLNNEVKGITIPDEFIEILKNADADDYQKISVEFVCDLVDKVSDYCAGFYISTPLRKVDYVCDIIKYIKEKEANNES